jgi:hypothetical protein
MSKSNSQKLKTTYNDFEIIIEEDLPEVGFYLYVYKSNVSIYDSLQNDINDCKEIAFEMFGIPLNIWENCKK